MIVYRFERNGIGPYTGLPLNSSFFRSRTKTRTHKKHRSLLHKELSNIDSSWYRGNWQEAHRNKSYIFGCPSKYHLRLYFAGDFKPLFQQGFRIKRYKVPDAEIVHMGIEVAFPVRYHKLQTVSGVRKAQKKTPRF